MTQVSFRSSAGSRLLNLAILILPAVLLLSGQRAWGFDPQPVPGRMLLKLHDWVPTQEFSAKASAITQTGLADLDALNARLQVIQFVEQFPGETAASKAIAGHDLSKFFVVDFPADQGLEQTRLAYEKNPAVEIAEYDWMHELHRQPNDMHSNQWYFESVLGNDAHVTGGWNHAVGDSSVLLAIADSGVDWQHPDLGGSAPDFTNGNVYTNWQEFNGVPGEDDDGNGFIDDVHGWDFVTFLTSAWPGEDALVADNDPRDFNGHGTHVAGIASATTDNALGVAGVGWNCKILPLRIGGSINSGGNELGVVFMSNAASAINYARQKGAVAVNCSWGSSPTASLNAAVSAAVASPANMAIVVSAGNDNNSSASYLSSRGDCIDVAASSITDAKAVFSSFGAWVDITAPGVSIYSTYFDHTATGSAQHTYAFLQGTSMSAPLITGVVGLIRSANPSFNETQVLQMIQAGSDNIDGVNPSYVGQLGAGRVNVLKAFGDRFLTVPEDYPTIAKAFSASADADTVALRGGITVSSPISLTRNNRYLLGAYEAGYNSRDLSNLTVLTQIGLNPVVDFTSGVDSTCIVDGFRITGGVARNISDPPGKFGGGLLCINASPTLRNCRFDNNVAGGEFDAPNGGAGALFNHSAAVLDNCSFVSNQAQAGAGVYVLDSVLEFINCAFDSNTVHAAAGSKGTGLLAADSSQVTLINSRFIGNIGVDLGGGLYLEGAGTTANGSGLVIDGNSAVNNGGGIGVDGASLTLSKSSIRGGAARFGAGIDLVNLADLSVSNSVFYENNASLLGGGIGSLGATASVNNCTFNANSSFVGGDALWMSGVPSSWTVQNNIVSNHAGSSAIFHNGAAPNLDYNLYWNNVQGDVAGVAKGTNAVTGDPLYVSTVAGDFELGLHSAALDAGDPSVLVVDADSSQNNCGAFGGPLAMSRAPGSPTGLAGSISEGQTQLIWIPSVEADINFYAVYRGSAAGFKPSAANFLGSSPAGTASFSALGGATSDWYVISAVDSSAASSGYSVAIQPDSQATDTTTSLPKAFALRQNSPNPFNPSTRILLDLPTSSPVRLDIFDGRGRRVRNLLTSHLSAGRHPVVWDGRNDAGEKVASGIYMVHVVATGYEASRKMTLIR